MPMAKPMLPCTLGLLRPNLVIHFAHLPCKYCAMLCDITCTRWMPKYVHQNWFRLEHSLYSVAYRQMTMVQLTVAWRDRCVRPKMAIDQSDAPNLAAYMYTARLGASDWSVAILRRTHLSFHATVNCGMTGLPAKFYLPRLSNQCTMWTILKPEKLAPPPFPFTTHWK